MKFALKSKTKKDKSTEIVPSLLLTPPNICACAVPRAKNGQQKVPILKKRTGLCPSRSHYYVLSVVHDNQNQ